AEVAAAGVRDGPGRHRGWRGRAGVAWSLGRGPLLAGGAAVRTRALLLAAAATALASCGASAPHNTGVYLLVDTSGSYNRQLNKAEQIVLYALSRLQPLDSIAVARIDAGSFSEKNIIAKASFDDRPSSTNRQKRAFATRVESFVGESRPAAFTDITGGILQAIEFLNEKHTGRKEILIFSDMKEDLAKGYVRNIRSEERRVGKECRARGSRYQ